jgi:hypothetical protein
MADALTDDELDTLRSAGFGAVALVANADPGFFELFRESFAASGALAEATGLVRQVFVTGHLPELPGRTDLEAVVLPALRRSVEILRAKAPAELENYSQTVLAACERAAGAADGVAAPEQAMLSKVRDALGS